MGRAEGWQECGVQPMKDKEGESRIELLKRKISDCDTDTTSV